VVSDRNDFLTFQPVMMAEEGLLLNVVFLRNLTWLAFRKTHACRAISVVV
jgi:hypothetical protein